MMGGSAGSGNSGGSTAIMGECTMRCTAAAHGVWASACTTAVVAGTAGGARHSSRTSSGDSISAVLQLHPPSSVSHATAGAPLLLPVLLLMLVHGVQGGVQAPVLGMSVSRTAMMRCKSSVCARGRVPVIVVVVAAVVVAVATGTTAGA